MVQTPKTDTGFAVEKPDSQRLVSIYTHSDKTWKRPFRVKRTLAPAYQHLIDFLDGIEPASQAGWDGGYAYRAKNLASGKASADDWSEHAAGNAIDWNASQHLQNRGRYAGWTESQVRYINRFLETKLGQVFTWGADFTHSDPMHFQVKSATRWADTWVQFQWPEPRLRR